MNEERIENEYVDVLQEAGHTQIEDHPHGEVVGFLEPADVDPSDENQCCGRESVQDEYGNGYSSVILLDPHQGYRLINTRSQIVLAADICLGYRLRTEDQSRKTRTALTTRWIRVSVELDRSLVLTILS